MYFIKLCQYCTFQYSVLGTNYLKYLNIATEWFEMFNPLPVQFKTLLHGQKGCVFSAGI